MKYSIITPVFNREDCIGRCVDSVIQNLKWDVEIEHVVVDDGSCDGTAAILSKYADKYPHIHFISFDKNLGTNAARNAAIAVAKGDYCIILDSDDYFVPEAIKTIDGIVKYGGFRHYCFAADDMMEYYRKNSLIKTAGQSVLRYKDFLLEHIAGDFIHVIATDTLRKYPFDEQLRIYEGVFFKRFYREAREILFMPEVVTIRERERNDSVTRDVLLKDKNTVRKGLKSKQLLVEWFEGDLLQYDEGRKILCKTYVSMLELNLLLGDYSEADMCRCKIEKLDSGSVPQHLELVRKIRVGWLYFLLRKTYVCVKFDLLKSKLS